MDLSSRGTPAELAAKKSFLRRVFPYLTVVNFAVGAYMLLRIKQKTSEEEEIRVIPAPLTSQSTASLASAEVPARVRNRCPSCLLE